MNPAPAHLEAKLRFGWDFTVGQIAAMIAGILIGFAWANWISPIRGIGAAVTGVYVGGLPVAAGFIASQTEFDLWAVLSSAVRWRRVSGRFVPGAGEVAGYLVLVEDEQPRAGDGELAALDTDLLWGDAVRSARTRTGPSANGARGR
jgi:drug/metabolite transporter (DMT)-like permease